MSNNEIKEYKEPKLEDLLLEDGPNGDIPDDDANRSAEYYELYSKRLKKFYEDKKTLQNKIDSIVEFISKLPTSISSKISDSIYKRFNPRYGVPTGSTNNLTKLLAEEDKLIEFEKAIDLDKVKNDIIELIFIPVSIKMIKETRSLDINSFDLKFREWEIGNEDKFDFYFFQYLGLHNNIKRLKGITSTSMKTYNDLIKYINVDIKK